VFGVTRNYWNHVGRAAGTAAAHVPHSTTDAGAWNQALSLL